MPSTARTSPRSSLYLITPPLSPAGADAFGQTFAEALEAAAPVACALIRLAPSSDTHAEAIVAPVLRPAMNAGCALLIENDALLAARLGADGVHVAGAGEDLRAALRRLKPDRIVGAGFLRTRDEAMTAGEMGADYVMFGEPREGMQKMRPVSLVERVAWWAEIFETPCVAYADTLEAASELADAGADFVALGEAIWGSSSPAAAAREAQALILGAGSAIP
jgi:thiamine-phosphate pyrophosphorylase